MEPNKRRKVYYQDDGHLTKYAKKKARQIIKSQNIGNSSEQIRAVQHPDVDSVEYCTETRQKDCIDCCFRDQVFTNDLQNSNKFDGEEFQLLPEDGNINFFKQEDENKPYINDQLLNNLEGAASNDYDEANVNNDAHNRVNNDADKAIYSIHVSFDGLLQSENQRNIEETSEDFFSDDSDDEVFMSLRSTSKAPTSIEDLKDDETFAQRITTSVDKSPGEVLLMVLKFALENQQSFTATTNLLKLINNIFDSKILPETRYRIDKLCNPQNNITLHGICPECTEYLGILEDVKKLTQCTTCNADINIINPSDPSFFVIIDPKDAVKDYLQCHEDFYEYVMKERVHERGLIKDIFDGTAYRDLQRNLSASERNSYLTMILNTDGAAVFKSSTFSVWPVYLMPNEIPIQDRLKSTIVLALWFGSSKPDMPIFLEKIVELLNHLSFNGINCRIKGKDCCIKIYTIQASVDTVARAAMNGTVQFNGHYGCDWCEHPGEYFSGSMRYPFLAQPAPDRNRASTIRYAEEALETGHPVVGVKAASPLLNLKYFDIITGFTPDYMHCVLAGVAAQYTEYFLQGMSKDQIEILNKLLLEIKVPNQIARLSRALKDRANWKAREWENWVLYYSLPLFMNCCNSNKRVRHWSLLVKSLHICLLSEISYEQLNDLNETLNAFVSQSESLYSLKSMTYNVHQLLHIPKSIQLWGPVFTHSTYPFESANHNLLCAIQSAKGVILQLVRQLNMQRSVRILQQIIYPNCSDAVLHFCERDHLKVKTVFKSGSIRYFGKRKIIDTVSLNVFNLSRRTKVFFRMVKEGCLFMSSLKVNRRSCNSFAVLKNGRFIKIVKFIVDTENSTDLTMCKTIETIPSMYVNYVKEIVHESDELVCVPTAEIDKPAVCIVYDQHRYITSVPNLLFY